PQYALRVLNTPQEGLTVFTDASSTTDMAVVVWRATSWERVRITSPGSSIQQLEALAVAHALKTWPRQHINVVADSMFVYKLLHNMATPGWAGTPIAVMLEDALQHRTATVSIIHVRSHDSLAGYYRESNQKADGAAKGVWTITCAREVHGHLHIGAK
ncbi:POK18 protein, partial [Crypturellus soui]|nr:POK18 protein [Crypturellus soui]